MQPINEMKLVFLSNPSNESFARATVAAFISQIDPTVDELMDVKTAISEAVTNAIIHGYDSVQNYVEVICYLYENAVKIHITDQGKGIENIELARQPLYTTKPELERSGMGFTVMENFMDKVDVLSTVNEGTVIIMYKTFKSINV